MARSAEKLLTFLLQFGPLLNIASICYDFHLYVHFDRVDERHYPTILNLRQTPSYVQSQGRSKIQE